MMFNNIQNFTGHCTIVHNWTVGNATASKTLSFIKSFKTPSFIKSSVQRHQCPMIWNTFIWTCEDFSPWDTSPSKKMLVSVKLGYVRLDFFLWWTVPRWKVPRQKILEPYIWIPSTIQPLYCLRTLFCTSLAKVHLTVF